MEEFSCEICAQKFMEKAALVSHVSICELFIDHIRNSPEEEILCEENEGNEIESENKCHVCGLKLKTKIPFTIMLQKFMMERRNTNAIFVIRCLALTKI